MQPTDSQGSSRWVRELRRHHEGTFVAAERATPVRFVIDGATGRLVLPVEQWMLDHMDAVIFMPEERNDALQVHVELDATACGAGEDRWAAYHGAPRLRLWAAARVVGLRREADVCDEREVCAANPLRTAESRLLRVLNAERGALSATCERLAGVCVTDACAVGIDPFGIDVRARFGIVRVEFPAEECGEGGSVECAERAEAVVRRFLDESGGAGTRG
jgi:hypothetical protein